MNPLVFLPYFTLHGLAHHTLMNAYVPFYQNFDTFTKHAWIGRTTALTTQLFVLPLTAFLAPEDSICIHALGLYILHDMLHCALYDYDKMTWIHHFVTFSGYIFTFWLPPETVHTMMVGTVFLELTSVFVQLCWLFNKAGLSGEWWYKFLAMWTLGFYGCVRCIYFPYYTLRYAPKNLWPLGLAFTILNWKWMGQLIRYAQKVLRKSGTERLE